MEKEYFDALMSSLEDAAAFAEGDTSRCRVVEFKDPVPEYKADDVARTRKSLKMSPMMLAGTLGVPIHTVEAWETGENTPSGAERRLLYLLDSDPALVARLSNY